MPITRRDFFVATAAATAATALPAGAKEAAKSAEETTEAAEVTARYNWIIGKWGAKLTDEQKATIRRLLSDGEKGLAAMRAYAIGNDAGPATPFKIYRRPK
jgi:hypothetical protein